MAFDAVLADDGAAADGDRHAGGEAEVAETVDTGYCRRSA